MSEHLPPGRNRWSRRGRWVVSPLGNRGAGLSGEPARAKGNRYGSRFWPLEGEVSLEEEGDEEGGESPDSLGDEDFFQDAIRAGFSVDELMRAEALAANASPKFASAHGVTGHARHVRRLTTRVVDAVAELRVPCGKWQGPLPKPRITPRMSLGDVWVTDQRSGDRGSARRLLAELESEARASFKNGGPAAPESVVAAAPASKDGKKTSGDWSMQVSGLYGLGCAGGNFYPARNTDFKADAANVSPSSKADVSASTPESFSSKDRSSRASSPATKFPERLPSEEMQRGGGPLGMAGTSARGAAAMAAATWARDGGGFGWAGQTDRFGRSFPRPGQMGRHGSLDGYRNEENETRMGRGWNVGPGHAVRERDSAPGGQGRGWLRPDRDARGFGRGWVDRRGAHNQYGGGVMMVQNMNEQQFAAFIRGKDEEIIDMSVGIALDKVADKVMAEDCEKINGEAYAANPSDHIEGGVMTMEVDGIAAPRSDQVRGGEADGNRKVNTTQSKAEGVDKMMAAAAIPEVIKSPTRSSPRLKDASNEVTMAKVSKRAAERALDVEGNASPHSFTADFFMW
ncbi:hypothetical protein HU200_009665 [Digitaria exilis]|uniref:Uncharacterized protein n=1 Tax=Digitaria exilis TaxID=1010633 RepID=A0A835FKN6_9POAL|nr:hypothetical protein HU200_009665 [Digitaria exilis]